ncbi:hypothetical protein P152DRAFT_287300 [Eremomyces bilateralis CBS 781.70]|uniref:Uncharacterized protein n=1 Tax=Eremomyces bilateralis CBS 781.70 TaxID=1392243 RepID=A0A6G1G6C2_9PEZI|nr:uncharacterized protein P152DRAFT_287300 [Eremomyces bilateralis CBS 781.70]KAF1813645.1 hypothetical protein P152DRAFT_287300 [Eremomyces bilateralis CBS 781.70]
MANSDVETGSRSVHFRLSARHILFQPYGVPRLTSVSTCGIIECRRQSVVIPECRVQTAGTMSPSKRGLIVDRFQKPDHWVDRDYRIPIGRPVRNPTDHGPLSLCRHTRAILQEAMNASQHHRRNTYNAICHLLSSHVSFRPAIPGFPQAVAPHPRSLHPMPVNRISL